MWPTDMGRMAVHAAREYDWPAHPVPQTSVGRRLGITAARRFYGSTT